MNLDPGSRRAITVAASKHRMQPLDIIRAAIRAVPAVKYALGVAGIFAVVAIVSSFGLDPRIAAAGAILVLVLMVVLVIFAKLTTIAPKHFLKPALVMTWAFLFITVATAILLCTSVFFGVPLDVKALVVKPSTGIIVPTNTVVVAAAKQSPSQEATRLLESARVELDSGAYAAAWKALQQIPPDDQLFPPVTELKLQVAQQWMQNISVPAGTPFSSVVDELMPVLAAASKSTNTQTAATAMAHLGYGNFLRWRDTRNEDLKIAEFYNQALKLDPGNIFAHVYWGVWIHFQDGPVSERAKHFNAAMNAARPEQRPFVRFIQTGALKDFPGELLRVMNQMRVAGESLPPGERSNIESRVYYPDFQKAILEVGKVLSPQDHLMTYRWLVEGLKTLFRRDFVEARLTEEAGDLRAALALYLELKSRAEFKTEADRYIDGVVQGIARCEKAHVN
jgi:hypothetical protein